MQIGVRDLRNRTAAVIDAGRGGERVTLTVNGEPVADIVPHQQRTLALARSADPIAIIEAVMNGWARLVVDCRAAGIQRAVKLTDALIAATAVEHGLPVVTQDDDYAQIARAHPALRVIAV